jgi:ABC-type phosphate transport system substrate-binding protein
VEKQELAEMAYSCPVTSQQTSQAMVVQRDISCCIILSASGSSGVATLAANTPYSLTYVESGYAKSAGLGLAALKNASGNYQMPDAGGVSAFLSDAKISTWWSAYIQFQLLRNLEHMS